MNRTQRPGADEHHEYFETYIRQVPDGDIVATLRAGVDATAAILAGGPEAAGDLRAAPGKWTVREILGHVIDTERAFGFRAFWFARSGAGALPSFEQDAFAAASRATSRTLESLFDEWRAVRASLVVLFESLNEEESMRRGIAGGNPFTARALAWIAAGHEIHHRRQIKGLVESHARS